MHQTEIYERMQADARRYRGLIKMAPQQVAAIAWQYPEACKHRDVDAAVDAAVDTMEAAKAMDKQPTKGNPNP